MKTLRVGIADDSDFFREFLKELLEEEGDIVVCVEAKTGEEVVRAAITHRLDFWTLDLNMPKLDGLSTIEQLMSTHPTPILVLTGQPTGSQGSLAFQAIQRGALDLLEKQSVAGPQGGKDLRARIRRLATVPVVRRGLLKREPPKPLPPLASPTAKVNPPPSPVRAQAASSARGAEALVGLGASTGGPKALVDVLQSLPASFSVPLAIVQHIPKGFAEHFTHFLQDNTPLKVRLVDRAVAPEPGYVYVAPDAKHLVARMNGMLAPQDGVLGQLHCPSVDTFFSSLAESYGSRAAGVLLTGMGDDGARGLLAMRRTGAYTVAQDEASSVVYGMPRAAVECDAASAVLPLGQVAAALMWQFGQGKAP